LPRGVRAAPGAIEALLGEPLGPAERRRVTEEVFVLKVLNWVEEVRPFALGGRLAGRMEVRGQEHVQHALAGKRGLVLISGHFGFPPLIRPVLQAVGAHAVVARRRASRVDDLPIGDDLWGRTQTLHRLRADLAENRVCMILADGAMGSRRLVPFLRGELAVGLGAFVLARLARCPLLPYFALTPDPGRTFQVEIGAPLPDVAIGEDARVQDAVLAFAALYATYVRRHPGHLYYHAEA
jgi:lauroyl/myristoyl acyltransferase